MSQPSTPGKGSRSPYCSQPSSPASQSGQPEYLMNVYVNASSIFEKIFKRVRFQVGEIDHDENKISITIFHTNGQQQNFTIVPYRNYFIDESFFPFYSNGNDGKPTHFFEIVKMQNNKEKKVEDPQVLIYDLQKECGNVNVGGGKARKSKASKGGTPQPEKYLEFKSFPYCISMIIIPKNTSFFRCAKNDPKDATQPRFFSDINVASMYKNLPGYNLFKCTTQRELYLMDIRFLKNVMLEFILNAIDNHYYDASEVVVEDDKKPLMAKFIDKKPLDINNENHRKYVDAFLCAFGLVSNTKQAEIFNKQFDIKDPNNHNVKTLLKYPRKAPFEKYSYRYSNFDLDDMALALMKANFGGFCDGYIGCEIKSPFHGGYFHNEICLFTPKDCKLNTNYNPGIVIIDACNTLRVKDIIRTNYDNIGSTIHYLDIISSYSSKPEYVKVGGKILGGGGDDSDEENDSFICKNMLPKYTKNTIKYTDVTVDEANKLDEVEVEVEVEVRDDLIDLDGILFANSEGHKNKKTT